MMRFRCPTCQQVLELDQPTQAVLCPACQQWCRIPAPHEFTPSIPAESVVDPPPSPAFFPASENDVEDVEFEIIEDGTKRRRSPSRRGGMSLRQRLALTRLGLGFHYAKFLIMMLLVLTPCLTPYLGGFACASGIIPTILPLLGLAGSLMCFWVPPKARSRLLIQLSFGLDAGSMLLILPGIVLLGLGGGGVVLLVLSVLASLASSILFMLFLRALAVFMEDEVTAEAAMRSMTHWLAVVIVPPLLFIPLVVIAIKMDAVVAMAIVLQIASIAWAIVYFIVVRGLLDLIATIRHRIATRYQVV